MRSSAFFCFVRLPPPLAAWSPPLIFVCASELFLLYTTNLPGNHGCMWFLWSSDEIYYGWWRRVLPASIVDGSSFDGDGVLAANYGYFERQHEVLWNGNLFDSVNRAK
ncbi:hypothetical protein Bca101_010515 [Brassica carinata]